jgi:hypothetical protein
MSHDSRNADWYVRGRIGPEQQRAGWDPWILEQDRVWVARDGTVHHLVDMSHGYRDAVLKLLRQCAGQVWIVYHSRALVRLVDDVLVHGRVPGELLGWELGVVPGHAMHPVDWLESTPLMRALRRYEGADPSSRVCDEP